MRDDQLGSLTGNSSPVPSVASLPAIYDVAPIPRPTTPERAPE